MDWCILEPAARSLPCLSVSCFWERWSLDCASKSCFLVVASKKACRDFSASTSISFTTRMSASIAFFVLGAFGRLSSAWALSLSLSPPPDGAADVRPDLGVARVDGEGGKASRGVETAVGITDIEAKAARPPRADAC